MMNSPPAIWSMFTVACLNLASIRHCPLKTRKPTVKWHRRWVLGGNYLLSDGLSNRPQVVAGLDDALCHGLLCLLQVRAWVVDLLVANFAVNLEHAVVVGEHVARDWVGKRVLGIGVHVHLDDAVAQRFFDLFLLGAGAAVEDEIERIITNAQ